MIINLSRQVIKNMLKIKKELHPILLVLAMLIMCLTLPITMVYISFQSTDEIVLDEAVPLNKKQGLPANSQIEKIEMLEIS